MPHPHNSVCTCENHNHNSLRELPYFKPVSSLTTPEDTGPRGDATKEANKTLQCVLAQLLHQ